MSELVEVCEKAARAGAAELLRWEGRADVWEKGPADLVTQADLDSQAAIRQVVMEAFPDHDFVGEEQEEPPPRGAEFCWIVDPLDGTTNYVHGVPHYCVSVAVALHEQVAAGSIVHPLSDECFTAVRGGGAWNNGRLITTSEVSDLDHALVAFSFPAKVEPDSREIRDFLSVMPACQAVRRTGSAALNLAYVAAGRFDGYWSTSVRPWDVAAGVLLVQEAGGTVTGVDGGPFDLWKASFVAASSSHLHDQLKRRLTDSA